jgi:hypothetical protein
MLHQLCVSAGSPVLPGVHADGFGNEESYLQQVGELGDHKEPE